jgi:hypothetical protein
MNDDFDNEMGLPEDELGGGSTSDTGDLGLGMDADDDMESETPGRPSGGARAKGSVRARPRKAAAPAARKSAGRKSAGGGGRKKSARKAAGRGGARKMGGRGKGARKGARKAAGARKGSRKAARGRKKASRRR